MRAAIGLPTSETAAPHGQASALPPGPPQANEQSNAPVVTRQQRAYLDGLNAAGVRPSSDLLALSIGSYVCQARAAKKNEQELWDLVLPLVRDDVRIEPRSFLGPPATPVDPRPAGDVNTATADYIRIATERLC